jgi:murein DD-endopeptidase MepM/ murein hydrolase activator NlpD
MTEQFRIRWPVDKRIVNQHFGENPDFYKPFGLAGHEGLDLYAPTNANVYAAADGEVYQVNHPPDHPYGLQIRVKHVVGGRVYRTVYAHLARAFVSQGQRVKAGECIAMADNTGNSFGSHLHLTLKVEGAQTPGYPPGIVDPWPFFQALPGAPPASNLIVYPSDQLSLRAAPTTDSARLTVLSVGEPLIALGDPDAARARIGRHGEWLQVQTANDLTGFVAAWFVHLTGQTPPASSLVVHPTDALSVRARPTTEANRLTIVSPDDALTVLGDADRARVKIGREGQWLNVRAPSGHVGYVAAWFVRAEGSAAPPAAPLTELLTLTVFPTADLNLRAGPTTNAPRVGGAFFNQPLTVIEDDPLKAQAKLGEQEQWLYVETETGERGWVAAWFLSLKQA